MQIDELLAEAQKQSNIEIKSMITDTEKKMVLYDSLTRLDHVLEAAEEYYEYVLRMDVEVVHEIGKIIIRKPMVVVVKKEEPAVIEKHWPKTVEFEKPDLILGKEYVMPPKEKNRYTDLDVEPFKPSSETEKKLFRWREFLLGMGGRKVRRGDVDPEGYILIKSRELDEHFNMIPGAQDIAMLENEGWTVEKIDELFKPTRIKEKLLSSAVDGVVHIDAIREDLWEDLVVIGEDDSNVTYPIAQFEVPSDDFDLNQTIDFSEEVLPTHPKDETRKPKWILSINAEKWLPKLEPHRHPEEKVTPISERVLKRRDRSRSFFDEQADAYDRMRAERHDGLSRRDRRN